MEPESCAAAAPSLQTQYLLLKDRPKKAGARRRRRRTFEATGNRVWFAETRALPTSRMTATMQTLVCHSVALTEARDLLVDKHLS